MSSNATTRAARVAKGLCAVCLRRRARSGRPTCATCAAEQAASDQRRYRDARKAGLCTASGCKSAAPINKVTGKPEHLCEPHSAARRKRRAS